MLKEGLESLADGVSLLRGEEVFELLTEGATVHTDARRKDLCYPLQGAKGRWLSARN